MKKRKHRNSSRRRTHHRSTKKLPNANANKPKSSESTLKKETETIEQEKQNQFGWVMIEHRDSEGNITLPKRMVQSTYPRRFDEVQSGTELKALLLAGYKPPLLMVERKIYEVRQMTLHGWRHKGQISIEIEGWRGHEESWFESFKGIEMEISDPGLPGPLSEKTHYTITESSFDKKILTQIDANGRETETRLYDGKLDISEKWLSVWKRQGAEIINLALKSLIVPLSVAIGAGLMLLWVDQFYGK